MTRFGLLFGAPAAARRARQRHSSAMPPSMQASLDPVVEQPVEPGSADPECGTTDGACHRWARMLTQRRSSSAVSGYSSLSIMFLLRDSAISNSACGSIHVVTNVARLSRAFPSRISSSRTTCRAVSGSMPCSGSRSRVTTWSGTWTYTGLMSRSRAFSGSSCLRCRAMLGSFRALGG